MHAKELFDNLKKEIFLLWSQNKNLSEFVKLPEKLTYNNIPNKKFQSVNILDNWEVDDNSIKSIHKLIKKILPYANWRQNYEEKDVGQSFLDKFAYFELFGPTGHFLTNDMSLYVIFFDKDTYYTWHNHEAEELYFVISGSAKFESKGDKSEILDKLKSRFHKSYQPHSLTTLNEKCLCIVMWRDKLNSEVKVVNDI